jgi:hypothetical protein
MGFGTKSVGFAAAEDYWEALDRHFCHQAQQLDRFRRAGRGAVRRMWVRQTNERGEPLSPSEREALIERHCELFGTWPQLGSSDATVTGSTNLTV